MATTRALRRHLAVRSHRRKLRHGNGWGCSPHKELANIRNRRSLIEWDGYMAGVYIKVRRRDDEMNFELWDERLVTFRPRSYINGKWVQAEVRCV